MNKVKTMLAIGVAMSAMHFAKAEGDEKVFEPTDRDGAEIDRIELVNGQILVRAPNAQIDGVKTPYVYVGTNTDHFAVNGFAQRGLDNVDQYIHAGSGKIIMTEVSLTKTAVGDMYTTEVSSSSSLNGVQSKITKVDDQTKSGNEDALFAVMQKSIKDGYHTKMFDGELYRVEGDQIARYNTSIEEPKWNDWYLGNPYGKTIEDFVIVKDGNAGNAVKTFVLYNDNGTKKAYSYSNPSADMNNKSAVSIALAEDKQTVILTNGGISLYNGTTGRLITDKNVQNKLAELNAKLGANTVKSAVLAGDIMYYATAKNLGWFRVKE